MQKSKLISLVLLTISLALFLSGCSIFEPPPELEINESTLEKEREPIFNTLISVEVVGTVTNVGGDMGDLDSCEVVAKFFDGSNVILDTNTAYYWDLNAGETAEFKIGAFNDDLSAIDDYSVEASCS